MRAKKIWIFFCLLCLVLMLSFFGKKFFEPKTTIEIENILEDSTTKIQKSTNKEEQALTDFYSRGSYSTPEQFRYEGHEIIIFIETVKNIMQDVDNPEYIKPITYIRLVDSKMKYIDYECPNPLINREKVEFESIETPVGVIEFHGGFVDKDGQPWKKAYAENYKTVIKGTLSIEKDGKTNYSQTHDFEYWDGTGD